MHLSNLIEPSDGFSVSGAHDPAVSGISADSRQIKSGYIFVAIKGTSQNGADFIADATCRGASAVVIEQDMPHDPVPDHVALIQTLNTRHALSVLASRFYPDQPKTIAAVTGTSGKTSTVQFTRSLWKTAGYKAASLGTLGLITDEGTTYGNLTTPDSVALHKIMHDLAHEGVTHLAMEASSQGIAMRRLDSARVDLAAFTNLSRDHLDYHQTMEHYFAAKLRLFTSILKQGGWAVLNADAPEFDDLNAIVLARGCKVLSYGMQGREIRLLSHAPCPHGQTMRFELLGQIYDIMLPLAGSFQVSNSLCALGLAVAGGCDPSSMAHGLERLEGVAGRLELIGRTPKGASIFVDYAHKPSALEHVLKAMRGHLGEGARLYVVFGCGGNRDRGKRPLMGAIAQQYADRVIVTDDNPRHEDAAAIRKEILDGFQQGAAPVEIADRAQAIETAIKELAAGDVLVVAGKGHEEGQIIGHDVLPFHDGKEIKKVLERL